MSQKAPKIIKRYQNRKLYDTSDSCHVTLEDLSDMIKRGEEIVVIDNETKEDMTAVTLAQIIFEEHKKKKQLISNSTLRQIIQNSGETIREIVQKTIETGAREIQSVKSFVDDKVRPAVENIQHMPSVHSEIKQLHAKVEALERKLAEREKKGR